MPDYTHTYGTNDTHIHDYARDMMYDSLKSGNPYLDKYKCKLCQTEIFRSNRKEDEGKFPKVTKVAE